MSKHTLVNKISLKYVGVALVMVMAAPSFIGVATARELAPVVEASSGSGVSTSATNTLEKRLTRLERLLENQTLVDLVTRLDGLQSQVDQLLGQIEEQQHDMDQLKKRQRDLYLDIDRRLRDMEAAKSNTTGSAAGGSVFGATPPVSASMTGSPAGGVTPTTMPNATMGTPVGMAAASSSATTASEAMPASDQQQERGDYERAFNLLKEGRYNLAVAAFKTFVKNYPTGRYADNAQYWLGEANYVQRNFKVALNEFEKVVKNYPSSPKIADALLKLGYTYQELGDIDKARMSLDKVVMNYPGTTAASLAQKRLQDLKQHP